MERMKFRSLFWAGFVSGLIALAFNFVLRLEGLAAFPPENALYVFISVVPASIEGPMVQQFGDLAGQLGLVIATLIGAGVYGALTIAFDRASGPLRLRRAVPFEALLLLSVVSWALFGLLVLPATGASLFGTSSAFSSASSAWTFPLTLLLVQAVFALMLSARYNVGRLPPATRPEPAPAAIPNSRREFIEKGIVAGLAVIAGVLGLSSLGSLVSTQIAASGGSAPIDLQDAPPIFSDPRVRTLVESEVTPNEGFYRVAIDIIDPVVEVLSWSLAVDGLVGNPKTYKIEDVQRLPQTSQYTTLECVSNKINGNLISNAKWTGVRISDLLQDVGGPRPGAKYVVFYSADGYSVGIPLSKAMEPTSIVVHSMNDQPLPVRHGFPLRGLIPGLWGMMSAKWIRRISVLDSEYLGYWQTRGWTNTAAVNTVAFIVTPESGTQVSLSADKGSIIVAGYAFAGDRGISKVELSFDSGKTWQQAQLKRPLSHRTWALWAYDWHPQQSGEYSVYARATDGNGQVQTSRISDIFPDGATGYAFLAFRVND